MTKEEGSLLALSLEELRRLPPEMFVSGTGVVYKEYRDPEGAIVPIEEMAHQAPRLKIKTFPSLGAHEIVTPPADDKLRAFLRKYGSRMAEAVGESFEDYVASIPPLPTESTYIETRFIEGRYKASYQTTDFFVDPRISASMLRDILMESKGEYGVQFRDDDMPDNEPARGKPYIAHGLAAIQSDYTGTFMLKNGQVREGTLNELMFYSQQAYNPTGNILALGSVQDGQIPFLRDRLRYDYLEVGRINTPVSAVKDSEILLVAK